MEEKTFCIYKHTNKVNGKVYIGQTCKKPEERWGKGRGYIRCSYFYSAIKKYGWDGFDHEILVTGLNAEEANMVEEETIKKYDSMNPEKGYNLKSGGMNNFLSEISKEKISKSNTGKRRTKEVKEMMSKTRKNRHLSEETKRKISESKIGKPRSEELKRKLSEMAKGKFSGKLNPMYGRKHTLESRRKISESNIGRKASEESKIKMGNSRRGSKNPRASSVRCIELGKTWDCIKYCSEELGINRCCITDTCCGRQKTAGGYHFEYVDKKEKKKHD